MEQTQTIRDKAKVRKPFQLKGLRWYIITLIGIATIINYIDRNALSIMWPGMSKSLGLTKDDYAWMITAFMVAYAIGQTATGKLFDKIGTRLGFIFSIIVWSVSIAMHSVIRGLASFGLVRFTLGFGEAGNWPGAAKSNAEWFPSKERAIAQGMFNAGASVGAVISAPLIAFLYIKFDWRITFLSLGLLGFIWVIPWMIFNRKSPQQHPWLTEEEREHILQDTKKTDTVQVQETYTWKALLQFPATWGIILSRFFLDPIWWLFVNWLPIYLAEKFLFDIQSIGAFAWVPYVGAALGSLLGGMFSSRLIRRGHQAVKARLNAVAIGAVIMFPALMLSAFANTPFYAIGLIALILFGFQFAIGNIQTIPSDFFQGKNVGTVAGMGGTAAVAGTLITTWMVPVLTKVNYVYFFLLGAVLVPLAYAALWWFSRQAMMRRAKTDQQYKL